MKYKPPLLIRIIYAWKLVPQWEAVILFFFLSILEIQSKSWTAKNLKTIFSENKLFFFPLVLSLIQESIMLVENKINLCEISWKKTF